MKDVSWLRRPQFTFTQCRLTIRHEDDQYHDDVEVDDCDDDDADNSVGDFGNCDGDGDDVASPSGINVIMMALDGEGEGDCEESWVPRVFDIRSHVKALFAGPKR